VRASFANRASLNAAFGYYRKLSAGTVGVDEDANHGTDGRLRGARRPHGRARRLSGAARMFENEYIVEEVRGGHFMHREHPEAFAERLLTHL